MKRKILAFLIILSLTLGAATLMSGCLGSTAAHYDFRVTFNYNTENLNLTGKYPDQYLGAMDGQLIVAPTKPPKSGESGTAYNNSKFKESIVERHEIRGWYIPKYNDDGSVMKDENGDVVLDRAWNFSKDRVTENVTLYAYLQLKPSIRYVEVKDGAEEIITMENYTPGTEVERLDFDLEIDPEKKDSTFYSYYYDKEFTRKFTFPYIMGEEDITLYAKFLDGTGWRIVSDAKEFNRYYNAGAKIYLDADIDFTDETWKAKTMFTGMIDGGEKGHTIRNVDAAVTAEYTNGEYMGLFGSLGANSVIRNVTFENVNVTVNAPNQNTVFTAAMFAWRIYKGARLEKVTVSGSISHGNTNPDNVSLFGLCCTGGDVATLIDCDFSAIVINNKN